jgi:hypothetical protein
MNDLPSREAKGGRGTSGLGMDGSGFDDADDDGAGELRPDLFLVGMPISVPRGAASAAASVSTGSVNARPLPSGPTRGVLQPRSNATDLANVVVDDADEEVFAVSHGEAEPDENDGLEFDDGPDKVDDRDGVAQSGRKIPLAAQPPPRSAPSQAIASRRAMVASALAADGGAEITKLPVPPSQPKSNDIPISPKASTVIINVSNTATTAPSSAKHVGGPTGTRPIAVARAAALVPSSASVDLMAKSTVLASTAAATAQANAATSSGSSSAANASTVPPPYAPPPSSQARTLSQSIDGLFLEVPPPLQQLAFQTLTTMIKNLLIRPAKDLYRTVRIKHPQFFNRLGKFRQTIRVLTALGFVAQKMPEEEAAVAPTPAVSVKRAPQQPTLSYGLANENTSTPILQELDDDNDDDELVDASTITAVSSTATSAPAEPVKPELEWKLTKKELREIEERKFMVLPADVEAMSWHEPMLQWSLKRLETDILPFIAAAAARLAAMDDETRFNETVKDVRMALDAMNADATMTPPDLAFALQALQQIVRNLLIQPPQTKFRKLPVGNAVFQSRVGRWPSARAVLTALGFKEAGGQLFMLPAFEKPLQQMTRIGIWLDDRTKAAMVAGQIWTTQQHEEAQVAEFRAKQRAQATTGVADGMDTAAAAEADEAAAAAAAALEYANIDRNRIVFPSILINSKSLLTAQDDDDSAMVDDEALLPGDAALIMGAQKEWARKQEAIRAAQMQRIYERTGVNLAKPPPFVGVSRAAQAIKEKRQQQETSGSAAAVAAAASEPEITQVVIRFLFPEKVAVQALFHPKEPITAVFDYARTLLADAPAVSPFRFLLPPMQRITDPRLDGTAVLR